MHAKALEYSVEPSLTPLMAYAKHFLAKNYNICIMLACSYLTVIHSLVMIWATRFIWRISTVLDSDLKSQVRRIAAKSPIFATAFAILGQRSQNRTAVTVERLAGDITGKDDAIRHPKGDVIEFFRELEEANVGKFLVGRRGAKSRFEWSVPMREVVVAALGTETDAAPDVSNGDDSPAASLGPERTFPLRANLTISLRLPIDLTVALQARQNLLELVLGVARLVFAIARQGACLSVRSSLYPSSLVPAAHRVRFCVPVFDQRTGGCATCHGELSSQLPRAVALGK